MIGLEYILNLYEMQQQELAFKLGIKKQNINLWFKGKQDVSKKHYTKLSEIFKGIPQEYFQKELGEIDKLEIQKIKLQTRITFDIGVEYAISRYDYEIDERKLLKHIENTLNDCFEDGSSKFDGGLYDALKVLDLIKIFVSIVSDKRSNKISIEKLLNGVRAVYQDYDTEDEFSLNITELINAHDEKVKKELDDMDDNEDLLS